ncbi:Rrf2 family transcriptional regulator [Wandonia haliotis]|uniref:Rrf2 family transcriptional regulator n=1 Tax=Wandonia haliotis TaxID=574963 RepID=A0ABN1MKY3_9FLAO
MLSKKSKYAIKALVRLARNEKSQKPLRISEISEKEGIPRKFLEAILVELRNNGLVRSKLGASGGYYLAKPSEDIELSQIIRISGGPIAMLPCVSLNFYERCEECIDEETCGLRDVMLEVRDATLSILSETSLADYIRREDKE